MAKWQRRFDDEQSLENGCKEALAQIEEKDYAQALRQEDVCKIIKYGIAFQTKKCRVQM